MPRSLTMRSASSKPGVWCWACGLPSAATAHQASNLPTTYAPPRRSERLWRRPTAPEALSCALRRRQSGEAPLEPSPTLMATYGKLPTIQVQTSGHGGSRGGAWDSVERPLGLLARVHEPGRAAVSPFPSAPVNFRHLGTGVSRGLRLDSQRGREGSHFGRVPRLWYRYLMVRVLHLPQALVYQTWILATCQGLSARGLGSPLTSGIERAHSVHLQPPGHTPNAWDAAASGRPPDAPRNRTLAPMVTPRSHHDDQPGLCQMVSGKDTTCP